MIETATAYLTAGERDLIALWASVAVILAGALGLLAVAA